MSASWRPSATLAQLRRRANSLQQIRAFFIERGYLEVETPILSAYGITDVYIEQLRTQCLGRPYYLQTSPEYPMKRLLAAGSGPIFQLARVFRDDERGRWHQPEFTLLEWYQLGVDHHGLMEEVGGFLELMLDCSPLVKQTYQAAFEAHCGINPHVAGLSELKQALRQHALSDVLPEEESDRDQYLFLLMSHVVEPALGLLPHPVALYDFPSSQAALARIINGVAARFEVYYRGVELANGFYELTDFSEQAQRFKHDQVARLSKGLPAGEIDAFFLAALEAGLPACSGVALGVDRLLALAMGADSLAAVLSFPF